MKKITLFSLILCRLTGGLLAQASDPLLDAFQTPPASAKPWVYWYFMDGNLTQEGMTGDLEAMQRAGIGGAIFLEVNIGLPRGPVEFMSPPWQELFYHAEREAERLGIQIALGSGPGWCGTGGPWIKPDQAMQDLVASETQVVGPTNFNARLPQPKPRTPFFGMGTLTPELRAEWQNYYRDVAVLAFPTPDGTNRLADADEKALYFRAPFSSRAGVKPFIAAPAEFPAVASDQCIATTNVIELTSQLSADGRLEWKVPPGRWTIIRFGRTLTGQTTRPAPKPGLGFECGKFEAADVDAHFAEFPGKILAELGPHRKSGAGLTTLHLDSWEMSSQNWSKTFRAEFRKRRGYDPRDFLLAYLGLIVDSPAITERFLWDVRQTASELVVEHYAGRLRELAHQHGLQFSLEPYDMNPAGDLALGAEADVPMGEFWADGDGFISVYSCLEATSIAHTHGKSVVGAEAFTGAGKFPWTRYPGSMKNQADWALALGLNRLTFHRFQDQPWMNRVPGMTMGQYGTEFDRTQTWWGMSGAWNEYITRCQFLLRQGLPVADILYLTPEGAPNVFRPPPSALAGRKNLPDRRGYSFDGCDAQTLLDRVSVRAGKLVLPDGMSYRVLVLPESETMTPTLLAKIKSLVEQGATVIGSRPVKSPSLTDYPQCDAKVARLAETMWGKNSSPGSEEHALGRGKLIVPPTPQKTGGEASLYYDYDTVGQVLEAVKILPDFESSQPLRYNHRHLANGDIYFVSNPTNVDQAVACTFRVSGRQPELWNPLTGEARDLPEFTMTADGRTKVPLQFGPAGSCFVVFRKPVANGALAMTKNFIGTMPVAEISGPWQVTFQPGRGAPDQVILAQLGSWSENTNPGVKFFSGEAVYHKTFTLAPSLVQEQPPLYLDLGDVQVMAQVTVNGHRFETLWCAPFRVNIAAAVRPGNNQLEIKVVNLWPNRMIGDAHLPPDTVRGKNHFATAWPQWLLDGKPSPTGRITFAAFDPFKKDLPLLSSGLLGPVRLFIESN
jgi:hypothetical protein